MTSAFCWVIRQVLDPDLLSKEAFLVSKQNAWLDLLFEHGTEGSGSGLRLADIMDLSSHLTLVQSRILLSKALCGSRNLSKNRSEEIRFIDLGPCADGSM
jgi:hypothetical protein